MAMTGSTPCSSMSNHTKERVTMTKVTLENFYSNLIAQHEEREMRQKKLEKVMEEEGLKDEEKRLRRSAHARKETEFLRLKRTRLGLEDFESLKVIGRGAFGEVKNYPRTSQLLTTGVPDCVHSLKYTNIWGSVGRHAGSPLTSIFSLSPIYCLRSLLCLFSWHWLCL
ncbi:Stk38 [Phodopus roborovskii]|uniref:Stk38 protein n=1 Tax=Phodopus roborovskii TaxID=109678 RepID=A0AAU9ZBB6_PHORO|nr:Stk38 [Phodopus roborovskii]